jgi:hypothetical protein
MKTTQPEQLRRISLFAGIYLGFQKGMVPSYKKQHFLAEVHLAWPLRCFHGTSKGDDPFGIFFEQS